MHLTFKAPLQKMWTLLDDKIICGKNEILLSDVQEVSILSKSSSLVNGIIQVKSNGKVITLTYPHKAKDDGEKALNYLLSNCGGTKNKKTLDAIDAEINALPFANQWNVRKELLELPKILSGDETIKALTTGSIDDATWLMVCTNRRLLLLDKGSFSSIKLIDIPLDRINSISHAAKLLSGILEIRDGATIRTIVDIPSQTLSFFADTLNNEINAYKQGKNSTVTQVINNTSAADELLKFKQLLDIGVLTQEEFDKKKKELLGL
ncbi:PH domain-containing protein [uncultured Clostridium sp.]|uniref:PH domain-containing protein n=1 Tax=uncultured Clostridium sp. TaxID=59620 RepID=UPI0025ED4588|nr:PH domain-containing protein [uncultured Clostridium sp.]